MQIHITKNGETTKDIADKYGISETMLQHVNNIDENCPTAGEELLILYPTRTYRVRPNDSVESIAIRFGLPVNNIYQNNPWIIGRALHSGEELALKYDNRKHGMSVANGYYYNGCTTEQLYYALPYLTYVSFCSATADERGLHRIFDDREAVKIVSNLGKVPLIRICDNHRQRMSGANTEEFAEELIRFATNGNYRGIVLNASAFLHSAKEYCAFLLTLRKMMIGCDLIIITEIDEKSPPDFNEYADGSILYYPKFAMKEKKSFNNGERKFMEDYACSAESAKTFIELPSLVSIGDNFLTYNQATEYARSREINIEEDKNTLLSHFDYGKQGEASFYSMNAIKSIFDLIKEFDYMGICFDIMRVPTYQLLMYNTLFKTSYFSSVRSREGCSRASGE